MALLPLVAFGGSAQAQTISNIAEARWSFRGVDFTARSNQVATAIDPSMSRIETYLFKPGGTTTLDYSPSVCMSANTLLANGTPAGHVTSSVEPTQSAQAGQDLVFTVTSARANVDGNGVDALVATISASSGDSEEIEIYETGPDTGVFVGRVATVRAPPAPVSGDCRISVIQGNSITISVARPNTVAVITSIDIDVLADPFGVVFDSETGEPVDGASVTLIDAASGQPAEVLAPDGVTSWPATVTSGSPIVDAGGTTYLVGPGEYWFPLLATGTYRLEIAAPAPYTSPSTASPEQLADLRRPGGLPFAIAAASFGGEFDLVDAVPVRIDVPVDRAGQAIRLTKDISRAEAEPGDAVIYTIIAQNTDPSRAKRGVVLTDAPARWLRFRPDSIRVDGEDASDQLTITPDGRHMSIALGDIGGGDARRITYAMTVLPDAPPGRAVNRVSATDSLGRVAQASAALDIQRESIAGRMTIIGRVTAGDCSSRRDRRGVPGVRVMLEDGSFAVTDPDGRYHFEGVVPGAHVVQAAGTTLPEGGQFIDCQRSSRSAGNASSRFVTGQGGSLAVADFSAVVPAGETPLPSLVDASVPGSIEGIDAPALAARRGSETQFSSEVDWLALGDGEDGWLTPSLEANPRAPAIRVAIRHRKGQTVALRVDGKPVNPLAFDGTKSAKDGKYAVSTWRGVPLAKGETLLSADILNSFGGVNKTIERAVHFTTTPARVELVPALSNLVADGKTRPVLAIRVLDRNDRPLRAGIAGEFTLNAPYQSAAQLEQQQLNQLTGLGSSTARWVIDGEDGIAKIELAPTMVSGSLRLAFHFSDGEIVREQTLETWIEPGDIEWTIVGLAEGSVGARTVADNMERAGRFESNLGDEARVALYAKGRVLGKYLVTLAYDSAKQREDQRLLGSLDPQAYYTVFADASSRRFDAASREKLYVRIETATFYALYGDFETGFDQTQLGRYNRTATGVKAEARLGAVQAQAFAADVASRFRRDEIQGQGISGPYRLSSRAILANSETVAIETRDRFRSELVLDRRELTRFLDYELDLLSGTLTFKQPVLSRDFDLNPQFIVIDFEVDGTGRGEMNAGMRASWTDPTGRIRVGATAISDKGEDARTDLAAADLRARIDEATELRAEVGISRRGGENATGWLVQAQHQTEALDLLAYARSQQADYGVGQQNGAERGRRKFGIDGRYRFDEQTSLLASLWQDESLVDPTRRRAVRIEGTHTIDTTDLRLGVSHFTDRLADGSSNESTVLEGGVTQRLLDNRLELSSASSIALGQGESIDLPSRQRFGARYAITSSVKLIGLYEIADGEKLDSRTVSGGLEVMPWSGGQVVTSMGKQRIGEFGNRSFAAFGLSQSLQVSESLTLDATIDGNRTIGAGGPVDDVVTPQHPVASGGHLGEDGSLFEDFTAITFGAGWRKDRWSATARGEYRDGEFADRKGVTFGAIRQLGEGSILGSGFTWTRAKSDTGPKSEILDASMAVAHRPADSEFAFLGKLEFRSDEVTGAKAGEAGPAGRTALTVTGNAASRRLIASLSTNWSPRAGGANGDPARRDEFGLFLGLRHNFDRLDDFELSGTNALLGADIRIGIGDRFEIGGKATVRADLDDKVRRFSVGPNVGFVPAKDALLTIGYNVGGFRDPDFSGARNTDRGLYAAIRIKFDADSFSFLGLGR